jgi:SAM-dependent methyltransferase
MIDSPMSFTDYKSFWDAKAATLEGAMAAVDGSADEGVLRATGGYSARQVAAALELTKDDRVLELGCGVGRIGRELAGRVGHWHGVDISSNMVEVARTRLAPYANTSASVLTRTRLDGIDDASFDKAYSVAVFIHMDKEDFFLYLTELRRVLKPGGRLFFDVWNLAHPIGWKRFDYEVRSHVGADPAQRKDVARNQFSTPQEVQIYLRQAGFDGVLMLDDSPQIQAVAVVPGGEDRRAIAHRLAMAQGDIAYSPRWGRLFERLLEVIYEGTHPRPLYDELDPKLSDPEIPVFRAWLRSFWKTGEERWGPAPTA